MKTANGLRLDPDSVGFAWECSTCGHYRPMSAQQGWCAWHLGVRMPAAYGALGSRTMKPHQGRGCPTHTRVEP